MEELSREEFERQKHDAEKRIRELYRGQNMPPYPSFVSLPDEPPKRAEPDKPCQREQKMISRSDRTPSLLRHLNISELLKSPDTLLILGLIFLLISDNADEKLILALIFIML